MDIKNFNSFVLGITKGVVAQNEGISEEESVEYETDEDVINGIHYAFDDKFKELFE